MTEKYNKTELQEALKVLKSLLDKCSKAKTSVKEKSSQETLLAHRIHGLQIAVELVEEELERQNRK